MKVTSSLNPNSLLGDKVVRRRGRVYIINKKNPKRKMRQAGPGRK